MKTEQFILVIILVCLLFGCKKKEENSKVEANIENQNSNLYFGNTSQVFEVRGKAISGEVPFFSWVDEKNQQRSINDYKGKVIIINFWATWCSPCREEIPDMIRTYSQYRKEDVLFLGISVDQDMSLAELANFVGENEINYQILLDNGTLQSAFSEISAIPTTFVISKEFKVVDKMVGVLTEEKLKSIIDSAIVKNISTRNIQQD